MKVPFSRMKIFSFLCPALRWGKISLARACITYEPTSCNRKHAVGADLNFAVRHGNGPFWRESLALRDYSLWGKGPEERARRKITPRHRVGAHEGFESREFPFRLVAPGRRYAWTLRDARRTRRAGYAERPMEDNYTNWRV